MSLHQQLPWVNQRQEYIAYKQMDIQYAVSHALAIFLSTGLFANGYDWPQEDDRNGQLRALVDQMDAFLGYIFDAIHFTDTELIYALVLLSRIHLLGGSCVSVFTVRRFLLVCLHIAIQMVRDYELTFWRWPELLSNLDLTAYTAMYAEALKILNWNTHVLREELVATYAHISSFIVVYDRQVQQRTRSHESYSIYQYRYLNSCYFSPISSSNLPQTYMW